LLTHNQQAATQDSTTSTGKYWVYPGKKLPYDGAKRLQSTARGYVANVTNRAPCEIFLLPPSHCSAPSTNVPCSSGDFSFWI